VSSLFEFLPSTLFQSNSSIAYLSIVGTVVISLSDLENVFDLASKLAFDILWLHQLLFLHVTEKKYYGRGFPWEINLENSIHTDGKRDGDIWRTCCSSAVQ
jgi:hypothetical protein